MKNLRYAESLPPEDPMPWELSGNRDGIEIFHCAIPGSSVVGLRGRGEIEAPLWKVASILLDAGRAPEWVDRLLVRRARPLGPSHYLEYNHIGTPFFVKHRDFLSEVRITLAPDARGFTLEYHPAAEAHEPTTGNVRGEILSGKFHVISHETSPKVELSAELHCDPKGIIPKWIVNLFQREWPRRTFEGIRSQARKTDIGLPDDFRTLVEGLRA